MSKVVATSQRYHITTIAHHDYWALKAAVFSREPCWKLGLTAGQTIHPNTSKPLQGTGLNKTKSTLLTTSPIEEILNQLPPPLMAFKLLNLDLSLITTHRLIPVGGRHPCLYTTGKSYQRPLGACNGQGIPLISSPQPQSRESSRKTHAGYNKGGRGNFQLGRKRTVAPIKKHQVRLTSPLFVVPKTKGGWQPIIDLQQLNHA